MRQVIYSILKIARGGCGAAVEDRQTEGLPLCNSNLKILDACDLRLIAGGDTVDLPKGGWGSTSPTQA